MKSGVGKLIQQITDFDTGKIWNCFEFDFYREDNWNYNSAITNIPMSGKEQLCKDEFDNFMTWSQLVVGEGGIAQFDVEYEETTVEMVNGPTNVQELVYNGRVGDAIKFVYREYRDNYARPAFTQEVQYDLSVSDEIGFQDLRLKVISATNTDITYILLRSF